MYFFVSTALFTHLIVSTSTTPLLYGLSYFNIFTLQTYLFYSNLRTKSFPSHYSVHLVVSTVLLYAFNRFDIFTLQTQSLLQLYSTHIIISTCLHYKLSCFYSSTLSTKSFHLFTLHTKSFLLLYSYSLNRFNILTFKQCSFLQLYYTYLLVSTALLYAFNRFNIFTLQTQSAAQPNPLEIVLLFTKFNLQ